MTRARLTWIALTLFALGLLAVALLALRSSVHDPNRGIRPEEAKAAMARVRPSQPPADAVIALPPNAAPAPPLDGSGAFPERAPGISRGRAEIVAPPGTAP